MSNMAEAFDKHKDRRYKEIRERILFYRMKKEKDKIYRL